jgi:hypothetical protein
MDEIVCDENVSLASAELVAAVSERYVLSYGEGAGSELLVETRSGGVSMDAYSAEVMAEGGFHGATVRNRAACQRFG